MKTAKQIKIGNRTYTHCTCTKCGNVTKIAAGLNTKSARELIMRKCAGCHEWSRSQSGSNWWSQFGLAKNPYVYGPMPKRRTSEFWRRAEARVRGWLSHYWVDDYTAQRGAIWQL